MKKYMVASLLLTVSAFIAAAIAISQPDEARYDVTCYSGGKPVLEGKGVQASFGAHYNVVTEGKKEVRISGNCIFESTKEK